MSRLAMLLKYDFFPPQTVFFLWNVPIFWQSLDLFFPRRFKASMLDMARFLPAQWLGCWSPLGWRSWRSGDGALWAEEERHGGEDSWCSEESIIGQVKTYGGSGAFLSPRGSPKSSNFLGLSMNYPAFWGTRMLKPHENPHWKLRWRCVTNAILV